MRGSIRQRGSEFIGTPGSRRPRPTHWPQNRFRFEGGDILPAHEATKIIGEVLAEIDSGT